MKKILLTLIAAFTFVYSNSFAQSCTPSLPSDGIHSHIVPDTIDNLPHATVDLPYAADIQFYVGTDTMVTSPITCNMHINNYTLNSIDGMPANFTYITNPSNGVFPGGSSACLHAYSTVNPTAGMVGTYPLVVHVTANVTCNTFALPQQVALGGYKIIIDPAGTVGIVANEAGKFELGQNIPNPASDMTRISFISPLSESIELTIFNSMGQLVLKQEIKADKGSNFVTVSTAEFADGMYIYSLRNSEQTLTSRMVVSKK